MRTYGKAFTLIVAAVIGSGLVACQRSGTDKSASSQDSSSPMNQAPRQGYTGPASPSGPNSTPSSTTGAGADMGGSSGQQSPGNAPTPPDQPQQQQQQR